MWWTTKSLCLVFSKIKLAKNVWQKKHAKIFAAGLLTENSRGNVIYCFPSGLLRNYLVLDVTDYKATSQFWVSLLLRAGREWEGRDEMGWKQYLKMYALLPQFSTEPKRRRRLVKLGEFGNFSWKKVNYIWHQTALDTITEQFVLHCIQVCKIVTEPSYLSSAVVPTALRPMTCSHNLSPFYE